MLSLRNISKQFAGRTLFHDVTLSVGPHDRIGLVGSNGTGKSTLLKIVAGLQECDEGSITKARYVTVGYLPQDGVTAAGTTLFEEAERAFEDIIRIREELEEARTRLASLDAGDPEQAETLEIYGELQQKLEDLDAFRMKSKIERVLTGLGFTVTDFMRATDEFSGGWQMRIALAKLLLTEPSILLLDEPTNHLDLDSLQWLEAYLRKYNGAVVLVSHDRALLDNLTQKTIAFHAGELETYAGNYSFYERESAVRRELQIHASRNQERQLKKTQAFIDRFRYKASKARQVQSRIKQMEKIERVEIDEVEEEIHFRFPQPEPSGATVLELKSITKRYGTLTVFDGIDYTVWKGDRTAVVGVNGAGKSTFAKILAGVEPLDRGERTIGYKVSPSYFAQHQAEELDGSKEALQILDEVAVGEIRLMLRTILGAFLFHGDDVFKRVSVLSGGEKSRLALAKMLLQPANFLILDEPTNHLDMRSKKVLAEALQQYEGSFVIVSHDRAFLDPLVNNVLEISSSGLRRFPGNVSDYLERKQREADERSSGHGEAAQLSGSRGELRSPSEKDRKRIEAEQRQRLYKILLPFKRELETIEREIATMEERKREIDAMMQDPGFYSGGNDVKDVSAEYKSLLPRLDDAYARWDAASRKIVEAESREAVNAGRGSR